MMEMHNLKELYELLLKQQGPSEWWPADSKIEIILGAILVQNTNWQNAARSLANLKTLTNFQTEQLVALTQSEILVAIRPSGFYRNKSQSLFEVLQWFGDWQFDYQKIQEHYDDTLRETLLQLRGIGEETADVFLLYIFDQPVFVADSYARRLMVHVGWEPLPNYQSLKRLTTTQMKGFTALEAQDFHGQIDEFGKDWLRGKDRFNESFLAGFSLSVEGSKMSNYLEITHMEKEFPFRVFLNDGLTITYPHFHKEIEIIHTKKGKVNIGVGQDLIELLEGETYIFSSGVPHYFLASPDSERYVFQFDLLMFDEVNLRRNGEPTLFDLFENGEPLSRNWPVDFTEKVTNLLLGLYQTQTEASVGVRFRIDALLHLFIADCYQFLPAKKKSLTITQPAAVKYQETLDQLNLVFDFIENHYQDSLTLEDVAKTVGFSPYYFTRFFKKNTGQTFSQFLTDYRVNQAKCILAREKIPMVEVAEKAGFASVKTFHHVFKENVGISPLKYQKNILEG